MITRFQVENYKALRNISLELTPIHALIGPNDSGKTSILNALAALSRSTDHELSTAFSGSWDGRELVWHGDAEGIVRVSADVSTNGKFWRYSLACRFPNKGRDVRVEQETLLTDEPLDFRRVGHGDTLVRGVCIRNNGAEKDLQAGCRMVYDAISGVHYYRWNPRLLALPTAPDPTRRFRMSFDGFGLALLLDDILGYDWKRFQELESKFIQIFPEIGAIKLIPQKAYRSTPDELEQVTRLEEADGKGISFGLRGSNKLVPAGQTSDGALLVLAYLAVLFSPQPPRLLLIEEPENGIHPKRLQDVLKIVRELVAGQSHTQVVLTTHSPYAVDLLEPREVTLCTKRDDGSVELTRLSESKAVREQLSVFSLGEIWTAEGDDDLAKDHAASAS